MPERTHTPIEQSFFLLVSGLILFLSWKIIQPFLFVLLLAVVTAVMLSPLDKRLTQLLKHPKLSAIILTVGSFFLVFIPILIILFLMVTQASELVRGSLQDTSWLAQLETVSAPIVNALPEVVRAEIQSVDLGAAASSVASWAFENIGALFSSSTSLVLNAFIFFLCLYYLTLNRETLYQEALALSPLDDRTDAKLLKRVVNTIRGVVFGVLLVAVIQGIVTGIGLTIFGVPGSILLGGLTILAALIPFIGTSLVILPSIAYLYFTGSVWAALGLLIWGVLAVGFIDNLLGPYLIGGRAHLHSFLVLIFVLGGMAAFGAVGSIAGPTVLALLLGLIELYKSGILTTGTIQK